MTPNPAMISRSIMMPHCSGDMRINSYALVTYVPDGLGLYVDQMRKDLEPGSIGPRSHVTLLPPRPIRVPEAEALRQIEAMYREIPSFRISLGGVRIFPVSHVIYIEVERGYSELLRIHFALNQGVLAFPEPWPYHPHLTIAQNLLPEHTEELAKKIAERWKQWKGDRSFQVESVTFVQNTLSNHWVDLKEYRLPELVGVRP